MFPTTISNSNSLSEDAINVSSATIVHQDLGGGVLNHVVVSNSTISPQQPQKIKRKRSLPGNPDPDAEVIALSPKTLLATNRFVCEICHKGFQRDQNLQLHRRGHNLPWKLKQRNSKEVVRKKAYVCPEPSCVHHNPSRALGDLTGVKKHYCRKHGEKKWKCEKCSKIYAVQSDWKAHSKTCGTREYRCDCGTLFSRKDSFITHRAFCDALAEESARLSANQLASTTNPLIHSLFLFQNHQVTNPWDSSPQQNPNPSGASLHNIIKPEILAQTNFHNNHTLSNSPSPSVLLQQQQRPHKGMITSVPFGNNLHVATQQVPSSNNAATSAYMSATAVLQKAATVGSAANIEGPPSVADQQQRSNVGHVTTQLGTGEFGAVSHQLDSVAPEFMMSTLMRGLIPTTRSRLTRDFLGLTADAADGGNGGGAVDVSMNVRDMLAFTGGVEYHQQPQHNYALLKPQQQGFGYLGTTTVPETWGNT